MVAVEWVAEAVAGEPGGGVRRSGHELRLVLLRVGLELGGGEGEVCLGEAFLAVLIFGEGLVGDRLL